MVSLEALLAAAARHGKYLLIAGLLVGLLSPALAAATRPWLPGFVLGLLFLAAFRIGPHAAIGSLADLPSTLGLVLVMQVALPLALIAALAPTLGLSAPLATALVLMAAAPSITGAPHLAVMLGKPPAPALRLMIAGTTLVPLTVFPVFLLLPSLGSIAEVIGASTRLLAAIAVTVGLAFALRITWAPDLTPRLTRSIDGLAAIGLASMVVGLMTAVGPALRERPLDLLLWLSAATVANFGLQALFYTRLSALRWGPDAVPASISAGNRNIALYLVALPAAATDPWLLFIGCYQIPMYLTPTLLRRLYR